jgi:regulator of CtrA degradation
MRENEMLQDTDASGALTQQSFIASALFERTFDEGMALVEETARYLDGNGREEARALPRKASMLYAGESMRVTTRLMQAASWLLVQRAVRDGDMEPELAAEDRYRVGSKEICLGACAESTEMLPVALRDLLSRSDNLYRRIARLDDVLFRATETRSGARDQLDRLAQAFGGE